VFLTRPQHRLGDIAKAVTPLPAHVSPRFLGLLLRSATPSSLDTPKLSAIEQPHKYATYGIVPSTAPSSDDEDDDTLPRSAISAPIEALQGLANAAAEAAAVPSGSPPRLVANAVYATHVH
jgi:hypothetical protein